ncbi:alanine racemase [Viridibacterium curvum]|uniref:Alanine racemase n=1 Tax=Viridibacterium curvum TaxID=1101404 RepID=A0ABP9QGK9_9RHOO
MSRPILARIDPAAFRHNYLLAKARAPQSRAWCVVKANAYGHGVLRCAEAVRDVADGFALLDLAEARILREAGFTQPILLLEGFFDVEGLLEAARLDLDVVLHDESQLRMLEATPLPAPLSACLKLNTGMNRLGFPAEQCPGLLVRLQQSGKLAQITLMTHFSDADGEGIDAQWTRFTAQLPAGMPFSCSNSAALLRFPQTHGNWVRPGIMLYGGSPMPAALSAESIGLRPVMTLQSRIIATQTLVAGDTVGYGSLFRADKPMRIGIVACGYADGYPRHAPSGTPVLVDGQLTRTVGRVSMDMLVADLEHLPQASVGTPVVLWGEGLPADDVATSAGTVSYELFCALAPRVPVVQAGH